MMRLPFALLVLSITTAATLGQTPKRRDSPAETEVQAGTADQATRAISELKRLESDVIGYNSFGEFEQNRKLARVSLATFENDLQEVTSAVERLLACLCEGKLKTEIANALDSYRDGAFWWEKIDQPQVVTVSVLAATNLTHTSSDTSLAASIPYTVAIHWRQAAKYLKRAEQSLH